MGVFKEGLDSIGRVLVGGKNKSERRALERRKASKRERVIFYAKVFSGEAFDRRVNLFDRRQSG
jgi:hypothetical protein